MMGTLALSQANSETNPSAYSIQHVRDTLNQLYIYKGSVYACAVIQTSAGAIVAAAVVCCSHICSLIKKSVVTERFWSLLRSEKS